MNFNKFIRTHCRCRLIAHTADLSALCGCSALRFILLKLIIGLGLIHELSECATKGEGIRPLKGRGPEMRLYYCSVVVMSMKKVGTCRFVSATFWLMAALVEHPMIRLIQC